MEAENKPGASGIGTLTLLPRSLRASLSSSKGNAGSHGICIDSLAMLQRRSQLGVDDATYLAVSSGRRLAKQMHLASELSVGGWRLGLYAPRVRAEATSRAVGASRLWPLPGDPQHDEELAQLLNEINGGEESKEGVLGNGSAQAEAEEAPWEPPSCDKGEWEQLMVGLSIYGSCDAFDRTERAALRHHMDRAVARISVEAVVAALREQRKPRRTPGAPGPDPPCPHCSDGGDRTQLTLPQHAAALIQGLCQPVTEACNAHGTPPCLHPFMPRAARLANALLAHSGLAPLGRWQEAEVLALFIAGVQRHTASLNNPRLSCRMAAALSLLALRRMARAVFRDRRLQQCSDLQRQLAAFMSLAAVASQTAAYLQTQPDEPGQQQQQQGARLQRGVLRLVEAGVRRSRSSRAPREMQQQVAESWLGAATPGADPALQRLQPEVWLLLAEQLGRGDGEEEEEAGEDEGSGGAGGEERGAAAEVDDAGVPRAVRFGDPCSAAQRLLVARQLAGVQAEAEERREAKPLLLHAANPHAAAYALTAMAIINYVLSKAVMAGQAARIPALHATLGTARPVTLAVQPAMAEGAAAAGSHDSVALQLVAGPQLTRQLYDAIEDPRLELRLSLPDINMAREPHKRMQVASFLHDRINMHGAVRLHPTALPALHLALGAIAEVRRQLAAEGRDVVAVPLGQVTCGGGVGGRRRQGSDDEEDAEHGGGPGGAAELGEGGDGDGDHPSPYGMRVSELADVAHNRICSTMMHAIATRPSGGTLGVPLGGGWERVWEDSRTCLLARVLGVDEAGSGVLRLFAELDAGAAARGKAGGPDGAKAGGGRGKGAKGSGKACEERNVSEMCRKLLEGVRTPVGPTEPLVWTSGHETAVGLLLFECRRGRPGERVTR